MTYIWNRADRINPKLMPKIVENAFNKWSKEQYKNFSELTEQEKVKINHKVCVQMDKMNYNLMQLGYHKFASTKQEILKNK